MYWVIAKKKIEKLIESNFQIIGENHFKVYPSQEVADEELNRMLEKSGDKRSNYVLLEISMEMTGRMSQPQDEERIV